jgi:predicted amidophosphoribosyltransferase
MTPGSPEQGAAVSGRVTLSRVCSACGEDLSARRRHAQTCGNRCRQQAHRDRRRSVTATIVERAPVRISFDRREALRRAVDRRRRELRNTVDADRVAADRALFADEAERELAG